MLNFCILPSGHPEPPVLQVDLIRTIMRFLTLSPMQTDFYLTQFPFHYVKVFFEYLTQLGGHLSLYCFIDSKYAMQTCFFLADIMVVLTCTASA